VTTACILIGNSDNKLKQEIWHHFAQEVRVLVAEFAKQVHFDGGTRCDSPYQTAAFVLVIEDTNAHALKKHLSGVATRYRQNSIAWIDGNTVFLKGGAK
jgi:hypothetical protein